jgi:hypothetical protein
MDRERERERERRKKDIISDRIVISGEGNQLLHGTTTLLQ